MKQGSKISAVPYIIWILLFTIVPFILVIYYAFSDNTTGRFTLDNIANSSTYLPVLIKSLCLAFVATLICLLIAYPLAYIMSRPACLYDACHASDVDELSSSHLRVDDHSRR